MTLTRVRVFLFVYQETYYIIGHKTRREKMAVFKHLKSWTGEDSGLMAKVRHESDSMDGATSYEELSDKPSINGVILQGNTELDALGVQPKGNYITVEETETRIAEAVGALEIPQEYITEKELEEKGYLTEHQDLTGYARYILCICFGSNRVG